MPRIEPLEVRRILDASLAGGVLTINGSAGADTITVSLDATNITVSITPEGFNQSFPNADVNTIGINALAGNDTVLIIDAVTKPAVILGGPGNDTITGGGGADDIRGEDGDDLIDGGPGGDSLSGDAGIDTLTYASRTNPVNVSFDDVQNDGETGENDVVDRSIDIVIGGRGNDVLDATATTESHFLYGFDGNDTISGGDADDRLHGGAGDDSLLGGAGNDVLLGSSGADFMAGGAGTADTVTYYYAGSAVTVAPDGAATSGTAREQDVVSADIENIVGSNFDDTINSSALVGNFIKGLGGNDTLTALGGGDTLWGGNGNDSLLAQNGVADILDGGNGTDTAESDPEDTVTTVP